MSEFLESYLTERKYFVSLGWFKSTYENIDATAISLVIFDI